MDKILNLASSFAKGEGTQSIIVGLVLTLFTSVVYFIIVKLTSRLLKKLNTKMETGRGTFIPPIKLQSYEVISSDRLTDLMESMVKGIRIAALVVVLYVFIPLIFSFFPLTRGLVAKYFPYIVAPVSFLFREFIAFIPNLFFIAVIFFITYFILKFIKAISSELESGNIVFPKFHVEWVSPTSKLLRAFVIVFAVILISPYLPGFGSPAFQGVSIFLGVLLSLGSTASITNMVAGLALIYTRSFDIGDRVKIADTTGDVVEKTMMITRLRTVKNVEVTIPNAMVLGSHIINFSSLSQQNGLILYTTITIGYDVPWRKVHELLINAGQTTSGVLTDPPPFVLQTGLNDFSVAYEINIYISEPARSGSIQSELLQNIQDAFNNAGVEILSPSFTALRDGNDTVLPDEYLPKTSAPKGFRLFPPGIFPPKQKE